MLFLPNYDDFCASSEGLLANNTLRTRDTERRRGGGAGKLAYERNHRWNKNRLCSKTCGIDTIVKNPRKNYSEIQSELFIMTGWQLKRTGSHPEKKS